MSRRSVFISQFLGIFYQQALFQITCGTNITLGAKSKTTMDKKNGVHTWILSWDILKNPTCSWSDKCVCVIDSVWGVVQDYPEFCICVLEFVKTGSRRQGEYGLNFVNVPLSNVWKNIKRAIPCYNHYQVIKYWACDDHQPSVVLVCGWIHNPDFFPKNSTLRDVVARFCEFFLQYKTCFFQVA